MRPNWPILCCWLLAAFGGGAAAQQGSLLNYVPAELKGILSPTMSQYLNLITFNDVAKSAQIVDAMSRFSGPDQLMRTIELNAPNMAAVLHNAVALQNDAFTSTYDGLSDQAKAFVDQVKSLAKETLDLAKNLHADQSDDTQSNIREVYPTMSSFIGGPEFEAFVSKLL